MTPVDVETFVHESIRKELEIFASNFSKNKEDSEDRLKKLEEVLKAEQEKVVELTANIESLVKNTNTDLFKTQIQEQIDIAKSELDKLSSAINENKNKSDENLQTFLESMKSETVKSTTLLTTMDTQLKANKKNTDDLLLSVQSKIKTEEDKYKEVIVKLDNQITENKKNIDALILSYQNKIKEDDDKITSLINKIEVNNEILTKNFSESNTKINEFLQELFTDVESEPDYAPITGAAYNLLGASDKERYTPLTGQEKLGVDGQGNAYTYKLKKPNITLRESTNTKINNLLAEQESTMEKAVAEFQRQAEQAREDYNQNLEEFKLSLSTAKEHAIELEKFYSETLTAETEEIIKSEISEEKYQNLSADEQKLCKPFYTNRSTNEIIDDIRYAGLTATQKGNYRLAGYNISKAVTVPSNTKSKIEISYKEWDESIQELKEVHNKQLDTLHKQKQQVLEVLISEKGKQLEDLITSGTVGELAKSLSDAEQLHKNSVFWLRITFFAVIILAVGIAVAEYLAPVIWPSSKLFNWQDPSSYMRWIQNILILAPLTWLGILLNKNLNSSRRLKEEYAHKNNVARTFMSLKENVEGLEAYYKKDDPVLNELRLKVLSNLVNAIAYNPAEHADKKSHDMPIRELSRLLQPFSKMDAEQIKEVFPQIMEFFKKSLPPSKP